MLSQLVSGSTNTCAKKLGNLSPLICGCPMVFGSLSGAGRSRAASQRKRVLKWMGEDRPTTAASNSNTVKLGVAGLKDDLAIER
jgi:hypothetical protein